MKSSFRALVAALPLLFLSTAFAQDKTFVINPDSSKVAFALGATGHHVRGTFHIQSGSISFDPRAQTITGSVVVNAETGNSGDAGRDKKMKNDVLDTTHFAEISFVPRSYQGSLSSSGDSTIQVSGTFTLHGTPHDLTVPMQVHIDGSNCTAKGQFTIPYVKWGLKDPSSFLLKVAKEVDIDMTLVGALSN